MSSQHSQKCRSAASSKILDGILEDAGMKNFRNEAQQTMRMQAAAVLIGQFQEYGPHPNAPGDRLEPLDLAGYPAAPEAGDIVSAVENAFARSGELDSSYIFVSASGLDITLAGWASSKAEISCSNAIAAGVKGVEAIRNELSTAL